MAKPHKPAAPVAPAAERANTFPWPPVLFVSLLLGAWLASRYAPLPWIGLPVLPVRLIASLLGMAGFTLVIWAILTLWRHNTTVMPDRTSTELVQTGPYRYSRNPIYLGEVFIFLTLAELTRSSWLILAGVTFGILVTVLQIIPEERHLSARFGTSYQNYKARVRRWI